MNPHLLIVDDDSRLRKLLMQFLYENGFRIQTASNAAEARSQLACHTFDLLIIDVMMPGEKGTDLTASLRKSMSVPILLLTALDQLDDKITGLNLGADDYLTKPFEPTELLARINALLRRSKLPVEDNSSLVKFGPFVFDNQNGKLSKDDLPVYLTSTELILLKTLAQNIFQPFSREDLAQRIGHRVSERTIDVQITRLRKKIGDDPKQPKIIQTVRHIGYALCPH